MTLTRIGQFVTMTLIVAHPAQAQTRQHDSERKPAPPAPIADNSFLVEEAYNQERGVVQHISTFARTMGSGNWGYTLTQEWPAPSIRHQLSFTVPLSHIADPAATGIGDIMLNYRFQAVFDEARGVAFSPRLSISLPTGSADKALGNGGMGVQANLPVSKTLGGSFVSHLNAGATYIAHAPGAGDNSTSLRQVSLGHSLIWLARPRFNVLLEAVWTRTDARSDAGTEREDAALLVPGIRWAHDFASGLQIVPGIGIPVGVGPSRGTRQLFLYLSFEHPFRR